MAIVKAKYTRSRKAAKANVRYITHRPGKEGEKITRQLFGFDGSLTKEQAYTLIDQSTKGTYFYKLKLSTDPRKEDWDKALDQEEVAKKAIQALEHKLALEKGVPVKLDFIAAIHDDHTNIRHVHILAFTPGRLDRTQLQALTAGATQEAKEQRSQRDKALGISKEQTFVSPRRVATLPRRRDGDVVVGKPGRGWWTPPDAPDCPRCDIQMSLLGTHCICRNCGLEFALKPELRLGREAGRGW